MEVMRVNLPDRSPRELMIISVTDNWLDLEFCDHLSRHVTYCMPHNFGANSNPDDNQTFYRADFSLEDFHTKYMCRKLSREVIKEDCLFTKVYANVQYRGMDGSFHLDDGDFTVLYMITPTLDGSGKFEYRDRGGIKKLDFVQNRLIVFVGGELQHRGMSPDSDLPRVTVAFKVNKQWQS